VTDHRTPEAEARQPGGGGRACAASDEIPRRTLEGLGDRIMVMRIDHDRSRFKEIVRGRIRQNLRKYVTHGEMIGRKGRDLVSIPIPQLDVPHFRYGKNGSGGVGQGDGEEGDQLGGQAEGGSGAAGSEPGGHILEVEVSLEELAAILGDELQLPRIEPKGQANISQEKAKYNSVRRVGPESLRHFKRTYVQAMRRQISTGEYTPDRPNVVPMREDRRYRSWTTVNEPQANAAVIYMMDVSGSMTDEQKQIVRTESFWIDTWLKSQYDGVETRYIIHDAVAREVDEHTFYHTRESGGTRISSAYRVAVELMESQFPADAWNLYCFQFSDGDNWGEDNNQSLALLRERILPKVNLFCYGQVDSPYGSGEFLKALEGAFGESQENLVLSEIADKEGIYESIKKFLGKGK
jgi:sporulation protein YhbH